jgi:methylenetetrahydrofolate dehydrogenase (NADP+)/methenyltetrahydrofolate cyclohydrolase
MLLLDGKLIAKKVEEELIEETKQLSEKGITPKLVTISTVKDESSYSYIKSQMKVAKRIGIDFELLEVKADNVFEILSSLNQSKDVHGIMIAHPVDKTLDELRVLKSINPEKDVEGRTPENLGKLMLGKPSFLPCTAEAVVRILTEYSIDTKGKNITIVGRSTTVGKPLSMILLLKNYNATVTICHTGTVDLKQHTRNADILVVATGKAMLINSTHVKKGAVVVDVGINFVDGKLVGDVDFDDVKETVNAITPVPGGVGPVTTVLLMKNVVDSAKRIAEDEV